MNPVIARGLLLVLFILQISRSSPVDETTTYAYQLAGEQGTSAALSSGEAVTNSDLPPVYVADGTTSSSADRLVQDESATSDPTTAESITTTTTSTTTTTTAATTTTTSSSGGSGIFSNAISGGSANGDGLIGLLGGSTTPQPKSTAPPGNFDKHLDSILVNLAKLLRTSGFDPIHIGKFLECRNCTMEGLSLIRRTGASNLVYANKTFTIDAHVGFPALYISCFPCTEVVLMVPLTGMLEVALWDLAIYFKATQKVERGANPQLVDYRVDNEGDLDISLNGYGLLGPVAEFGFKVIHQRRVSSIIREFVYERVPAFIQQKMKGFSFPIGKR